MLTKIASLHPIRVIIKATSPQNSMFIGFRSTFAAKEGMKMISNV